MDIAKYLGQRIFKSICKPAKKATFRDYLKYLDAILNGKIINKAVYAFRMITDDNSVISFDDIKKMITEVIKLWFYLTGS